MYVSYSCATSGQNRTNICEKHAPDGSQRSCNSYDNLLSVVQEMRLRQRPFAWGNAEAEIGKKSFSTPT